MLGLGWGIDVDEFERTFRTAEGYKMWSDHGPTKTSPHATATVLSALKREGVDHGFDYLLARIDDGTICKRFTAYYAYFVVEALMQRDAKRAKDFINKARFTRRRATKPAWRILGR